MRTNGIVTLFRFDEKVAEYARVGTFPAWVYRQTRTRATESGAHNRDVFDVRIAHKIEGGVHTDDLICFRRIDTSSPPMDECSRIAAAVENRVGLRPHWHIEAENQYR